MAHSKCESSGDLIGPLNELAGRIERDPDRIVSAMALPYAASLDG